MKKEFNLNEYLKDPSRKVVTRDGREVRIICTDYKGKMDKPVIGLIKVDENEENAFNFKKNGRYHLPKKEESHNDLFFASIKKDGWVNIFKDKDLPFINGDIYESKDKAEENAIGEPDFIATIKIEWEE